MRMICLHVKTWLEDQDGLVDVPIHVNVDRIVTIKPIVDPATEKRRSGASVVLAGSSSIEVVESVDQVLVAIGGNFRN